MKQKIRISLERLSLAHRMVNGDYTLENVLSVDELSCLRFGKTFADTVELNPQVQIFEESSHVSEIIPKFGSCR